MYLGLFAALLVSLLLTFIAVILLRRKGPWASAWSFFLVLFLALCIVSIYVAPIGPVFFGIAWMPLLVTGILLALFLLASIPAKTDEPDRGKTTGQFFWILICLFIIAIILGMVNPQKAL